AEGGIATMSETISAAAKLRNAYRSLFGGAAVPACRGKRRMLQLAVAADDRCAVRGAVRDALAGRGEPLRDGKAAGCRFEDVADFRVRLRCRGENAFQAGGSPGDAGEQGSQVTGGALGELGDG